MKTIKLQHKTFLPLDIIQQQLMKDEGTNANKSAVTLRSPWTHNSGE